MAAANHYRDPWQAVDAVIARQAAGEPPPPMLSRAEAMAKADDFLRDDGASYTAISATPNPLQGLWMVGYHDPNHPGALNIGGSPLIVPAVGPVYWANGSAPPWPEERGLEVSESSRYDSGEDLLGAAWSEVLRDELDRTYFDELLTFVADDRGQHDIYPPPSQTFRAFELTPYDDVKVVLLGQDPYPNPGQAHGLAFSVPAAVTKLPPSLRNIHRVLNADVAVPMPEHGSLEGWATQGVLLLNTALTVRSGSKADRQTHRRWRYDGQGWSSFTDAVIRAVSAKDERVVFILWGADAKQKAKLIDDERHTVIESSHPSPYSARLGFLTSHPFSEANKALGERRIEWGRLAN